MKIPTGVRGGLPVGKSVEERKHLTEKFGNEKAGTVPCPMISILLMEDMLTPDKDGNVDVAQLKKALGDMGLSSLPKHGLGSLAASSLSGSLFARQVNVFELFGSSIDHKGSLGPLAYGGFSRESLEGLKSLSQDGESLTLEDLAVASVIANKTTRAEHLPATMANDPKDASLQHERESGGRDLGIQMAEVSALLLVFGTKNKDGKKSLSLKDVETLFADNRIPESFQKPSVGLTDVAWSMSKMAFMMNTTAAGRAEKGLRDALDMAEQLGAPDALAGLALLCPAGMRPKAGVGVSEKEIAELHAGFAKAVQEESAGAA